MSPFEELLSKHVDRDPTSECKTSRQGSFRVYGKSKGCTLPQLFTLLKVIKKQRYRCTDVKLNLVTIFLAEG
jgi:hypothetical protein